MGRNCSDPFVDYLKSIQYSAVRHPRANLRPLQLLVDAGNGALDYLGDLGDVFVAPAGQKLPEVDLNGASANISGQRTGDLSLGIGLTLLGSIIGAMGGSSLGLKAHYRAAKTVAFTFFDVLTDVANIAQLDQFISASDVNPTGTAVARMLDADDIYVITDTIKSCKISVEAAESSGAGLDLDVPVIQQVVGGNVNVSKSAGAQTALTYAGSIPLVFGFQAVRLWFEGGRFKMLRPAPSGGITIRALGRPADSRDVDGSAADLLTTDEPFIRVASF